MIIPSINKPRPTVVRLLTKYPVQTYILVNKPELKAYRKALRDLPHVTVVGTKSVHNIVDKRKLIIDFANYKKFEDIFVFDDDIYRLGAFREIEGSTTYASNKQELSTEEEVKVLKLWWHLILKGRKSGADVLYSSIPIRSAMRNKPDSYMKTMYGNPTQCIHIQTGHKLITKDLYPDYNELPILEDIYFSMALRELGNYIHRFPVLYYDVYEMIRADRSGIQYPKDTKKLQELWAFAVNYFVEKYPKYCKVRKKLFKSRGNREEFYLDQVYLYSVRIRKDMEEHGKIVKEVQDV